MLRISYTIAENQVAQSGTKSYYVQVIDSKNNVLGDKKSETLVMIFSCIVLFRILITKIKLLT
jgi:hypothetical protein